MSGFAGYDAIDTAQTGLTSFVRQQRPGLHSRPFEMIKFRTMTDAKDVSGNLLPDSDRLPSHGRHQPARIRGQDGIMKSVAGTKHRVIAGL